MPALRLGVWNDIDVWTDTNYAGCRETRKSTSGGVILLGKRTIKGLSRTQRVIALSFGEAEYVAAEAIGSKACRYGKGLQ